MNTHPCLTQAALMKFVACATIRYAIKIFVHRKRI